MSSTVYKTMSDKQPHVSGNTRRSLSRRRFVQAVGATGAASTVTMAGCIADDDDDEQVVDDPEELEIEEGTTVEIYADPDLGGVEDGFIEAMEEAGLDENVEIDVIAGPRDTDDRRDQITSDLEANRSSPDIMMTDSGWTVPFIARGQALNLEANMSQEVIDKVKSDYFEATIGTASNVDGELHALPLFPDFPTMQYRKDLFEQTGYNPEEEGWATDPPMMDEFSFMIQDVQDDHGLDYGYTTQANAYEGLSCCTFNEAMTSWGGAYFGEHENLFGPIGDRPITVEEEPVLNAIRMMRTFINGNDDPEALDDYAGGICSTDVLAWIEEDARGPFTAGDAAAHRNWPYSIIINGTDPAESDEGEGFGEDLGVMPIPGAVPESETEYDGTGGPVAALGGWHFMVNPNSDNVAAALNVMETITEDSVQLFMFRAVGWAPPQPALFESDEARELEPIGRYLDSLQVAGENAVARPVTEAWPTQSSSVYQEVHDAYSQNKSPEEAMTDLANDLADIEESF